MSMTLFEWLAPEMGQMTEVRWQEVVREGESQMLRRALDVARRGDAQSLAALCRVLAREGPGPVLRHSQAVDIPCDVPVYSRVKPGDWDDPAMASKTLHTQSRTWYGCHFEDLVALCLARPVVQGQVAQPRHDGEDRALPSGTYLPVLKERLEGHQQQLLDDAITLFNAIVPVGRQAAGVARFFVAVTRSVAWPGLLDAFSAAGADVDDLLRRPCDGGCETNGRPEKPLVQAIRYGNPVVARVIADRLGGILGQGDDLYRALPVGRTVAALRHQVGDEALESDERFLATLQWCERLCRYRADTAAIVLRCLQVAAFHLEYETDDGPCRSWSDTFVRVALHPVASLSPQVVLDALRELETTEPIQLEGSLRTILRARCHPVLEELGAPALQHLMSGDLWSSAPYGGWEHLADPLVLDDPKASQRWKQSLQVLQAAGVDPTGRLQQVRAFARSGESGSSATLLHCLAEVDRGVRALPRMVELLEFGADPMALDEKGRTPGEALKDEDVRRQWNEVCLSYQARSAARKAILWRDVQAP